LSSQANRCAARKQDYGTGMGPNRPASAGTARHQPTHDLPPDVHKRPRTASAVTVRHAGGPTLSPRVRGSSPWRRTLLTWAFPHLRERPASSEVPAWWSRSTERRRIQSSAHRSRPPRSRVRTHPLAEGRAYEGHHGPSGAAACFPRRCEGTRRAHSAVRGLDLLTDALSAHRPGGRRGAESRPAAWQS